MTTRKIISELESLVTASPEVRKGRGLAWIQRGLSRIKVPRLTEAIANNESLVPIFSNHYKMDNMLVKPVASLALRMYWQDLDPFFCDVNAIMKILSNSPEKRELFKRPEARRWLNAAVQQFYNWIYEYTWGCDDCG